MGLAPIRRLRSGQAPGTERRWRWWLFTRVCRRAPPTRSGAAFRLPTKAPLCSTPSRSVPAFTPRRSEADEPRLSFPWFFFVFLAPWVYALACLAGWSKRLDCTYNTHGFEQTKWTERKIKAQTWQSKSKKKKNQARTR